MNDNIIKMFIGGEEVVSNKEFTINEEMLSASSTILNNCYPASWEETKDYVSNFYYPKDYSKYILGKGNFTYGTDQYSILSVSGETFMQFTTNVEKEWNSLNIYGNTYQETRSGKNEFDNSNSPLHKYGVSTSQIDTGIKVICNSTTTNIFAGFVIKDLTNYVGKTVRMKTDFVSSSNNSGRYYIGLSSSTGTNRLSKADTTISGTEISFVVPELSSGQEYLIVSLYGNGGTGTAEIGDYVDYTNIIVTIDNADMSYEQYGASPSPDYPSEIISVGYQNLFDGQLELGGLNSNTGNNSETNDCVRSINFIEVLPNKNIILFNDLGYSNYIYEYDENYNFIKYTSRAFNNIIRTSNTTKYVKFSSNPSEYQNDLSVKYQLEYGVLQHSYIENSKYGIDINIIGKNMFSGFVKGKGLNSNTGVELESSSGALSDYISVDFEKDTSYTVSGLTDTLASYIAGYDEDKVFTGRTSAKEITNLTFYYTTFGGGTPSSNKPTKYIRVYQYVRSGVTGTIDDVDNLQVMLNKGTTVIEYEPYKSSTTQFKLDQPLRSLPNGVKDIAYIKNNILYVDRKVGSVVLDGSDDENWTLNGSNQGYGIVINDVGGNSNSSIISGGYCNCLSETIQSNIYSGRKDNVFATLGGTVHKIYVRYNSSITSIALLKEQLNSQPIIVQYELAESYTEEVGKVDIPYSYEGINNTTFDTGIDTEETIYYYWKNYDVLFAGIVKNSGDISLRPTDPKYCSLQILDYKTFLSESDTLDFVISDKTIAEAISMVVDAISGYGFILGTINISQADDVIGAYSTLNKTAYDVFQYLANISGSRWRARFVDSDTMAIDFYDPELLPRANDIDYTQQYWEDNKIVDLTFNYGTRDYRNKQIILSDEVYGGIDYTEVLLSNGYGTSYITQNNIANITSITVNGVKAEVITQSEKDLGVDADFYYTPGKNVVESTTSYTAGTQIIITYTPLVKGRQIVYNDEEVTRIATQTNTTGVISRYENRNDILSSDELKNIAETYIKYKGKPEIILKITTLNNDLFNIGEICYFNSLIADLAQDYMVKSKATNYTSVAGETNIFYTYELTSSFNSEKAINYFDNQRNKTTGNIAEGESITRNIDINNSAMIIWENATITEISVSVDGDNALNSVLNSPFIQ